MSVEGQHFSELEIIERVGHGAFRAVHKTRQPVATQKSVAAEKTSMAPAARGAGALAVCATVVMFYLAPWAIGGPTPQPSAASTPTPSAPASKTATEVEKWFARVDAPQQDAFQKQVRKPFEAAVADLRARYLAALDAAIAKSSAAGQLKNALAWRAERQAFEKARNVAADTDETMAGIKALRAGFRQQLTKLDQDRVAKAKALFVPYDAVLAKNQLLLTQRQRLDDALLIQTKRDEIALAWLAPSTLINVAASGSPEPAKPVLSTPAAKDLPVVVSPASVSNDSHDALTPVTATKEAPYENTLGMKFVPVPIQGGPTSGQRVLFSVWDTRVQDYEAFATETKREWSKSDDERAPTHPAVMMNWEDAQAFCQWLTAREQAAGRLPAGWLYRLPSDHEWSCAAGIGARENPAKLPADKNQKVTDVFPWGTQWPPPGKAGNYASEELQLFFAARKQPASKDVIPGYHDGYATTSPVGSFPANHLGLFDMGGNVFQWCEDWYDKDQRDRVLRGAAWSTGARNYLLSSSRHHREPTTIYSRYGFRCVLNASSR